MTGIFVVRWNETEDQTNLTGSVLLMSASTMLVDRVLESEVHSRFHNLISTNVSFAANAP